MDTLKAIELRSSIRSYKDKQITDKELETVLWAADRAQRIGGLHLTILQNKEVIANISECAKQAMLEEGGWTLARASEKGYQPLYNAPTVILVSSHKHARYTGLTVGLTAQHMIMAATSMGLGSCFVVSVLRALEGKRGGENKRLLNIPDDYKVLCAITLGYTDDPEAHKFKGAGKLILNYIK